MNELIVHLSHECLPFSKHGGLADVVGALPVYLSRQGLRNVVFSPFYQNMMRHTDGFRRLPGRFRLAHNGRIRTYSLIQSSHRGVEHFFIECGYFFDRRGIYHENDGSPYADTIERANFFSHAVADALRRLLLRPDHVFVHEWQGASVFNYLKSSRARKYYVIHNFQFQGRLKPGDRRYVDSRLLPVIDRLERRYGSAAIGSLALQDADHVIVVSPSYLKEMLAGKVPCENMDILSACPARKLVGLLNGIDEESFGIRRGAARLLLGQWKAAMKRLVQRRHPFTNPQKPLVLMMSRLVKQKGIDLFLTGRTRFLLTSLLGRANLLVCGEPGGADPDGVDRQFKALSRRFPGRFVYVNRYSDPLARLLFSGADVFLMPSVFEPCGLTQMYAMSYATVPVAHAVGGLKDSISDETAHPGRGTGFLFHDHSLRSMTDAVGRAIELRRDRAAWHGLMERALSTDHSWNVRGKKYLELIRKR